MTLLDIKNISKSFGGVRALHNVSFATNRGDILGIMGANGAGKTTLFSVIAGHTKPTSGGVSFNGKSLARLRPDRICRAGIARTFQIVRPFRALTAHENVTTAALFGADSAANMHAAHLRADEVLDTVGLSEQSKQLAGNLTLAAQKKLEIAKALATRPQLLLLDEVMAGLTPSEVKSMLEVIRHIREHNGLTILIIEHVMRALMDLSERIIVLHHGEKIAEGEPQEIADNPAVQSAYLGDRK
jgi:branched-chain amino acid transport system ATP-binding protein